MIRKRRIGKEDTVEVHRSPRREEQLLSESEAGEETARLQEEIRNLPPFKQEKEKSPTPSSSVDDTEVTAGLEEATPVGGEKKAADAPPATAPIVKDGEHDWSRPLTDEEFEGVVSKYQPTSPAERRGFPGLREQLKKANALALKFQSEKAETDKKLKDQSSKILSDEELGKLRNYEQVVKLFAVDRMAEWGEYDRQVAELDKQAYDFLLARAPVDPKEKADWEKGVKIIHEKHGGLHQFATSNEPTGTPLGTKSQYFQKIIYSKLNPVDQARLMDLIGSANKKAEEKDTKIKEARANSDETLKKMQETTQARFNKTAKETTEKFISEEFPALGLPTSRPEIPEGATPEQKKEITQQQNDWDEADKEIVRTSQPNYRFIVTPAEDVRSRIESALYKRLKPIMVKLRSRVSELEIELAKRDQKIEAAKDLRRTNRLSSSGAPPKVPKPDILDQTDQQAVEAWARGTS